MSSLVSPRISLLRNPLEAYNKKRTFPILESIESKNLFNSSFVGTILGLNSIREDQKIKEKIEQNKSFENLLKII